MSIPKKIHYCWFGGKPLPESAKRCMETWKTHCPDYEIIRWDESNFDRNCCAYAAQAFAAGKWAFVSDVARLHALVGEGGIYMDTDVELTAALDPFLEQDAVLGFESGCAVGTGLMACCAQHPFFCAALEQYGALSFLDGEGRPDLTTNVERTTVLLEQGGLVREDRLQQVCGVTVYPAAVFSPKDLATGKIRKTKDTCAIHHYDASWFTLRQRVNTRLAQLLGPRLTRMLKTLLKRN